MNREDPLSIVGALIADKYRVERLVGEGGFAVVYRAMHTVWQLPVAIKFFNALAFVPSDKQADFEESFLNEGRLLARLSSRTSAIVQAHDIGTFATPAGSRIPYLVLEWVDGRTLDDVLEAERAARAKPWTFPEIRRLLGPVALAMDVVHDEGVAHRDLKPANILVLGGDPRREAVRIKILDFGVAKMMLDNARFHAALAVTGRIVHAFTPLYGAPEQFSRKYGATGPWTDVYALALIAVEMLSGKPPLDGRDVADLSRASCDPERRPTPRTLGVMVPDGVEHVFKKALAVNPPDRYARAGDFWSALEAALETMFSSPEWQTPSPSMVAVHAGPQRHRRGERGKKSSRRAYAALAIAGGLVGAGGITVAAIALSPRGGGSDPASAERVSAARVDGASPRPSSSAVATAGCPAGMISVAPAKFFMGSDEKTAPAVERPAHSVELGAFCIDAHEVTVDDYRRCADSGGCKEARETVEWTSIREKERVIFSATCNARAADRGAHPMNCVSWEDAVAYCAHRAARLPTEAEWEYAARGKKLVGRYPWGDGKPGVRLVNACDLDCARWSKRNEAGLELLESAADRFATTAPVGSFRAGCSKLGVCELADNVREWTSDVFARYGATPPPAGGAERAVRGGAWTTSEARELRRTHRVPVAPGTRRHDLGFRCAKSL